MFLRCAKVAKGIGGKGEAAVWRKTDDNQASGGERGQELAQLWVRFTNLAHGPFSVPCSGEH